MYTEFKVHREPPFKKRYKVNAIINNFSDSIPSNIQSVTEGTDQTSGECSLGQTIPI